MPLIAELIRQLDQLPGAETVVKVFQLNNSDATALSQALTTLFSSQTQGGGGQGGANLSLAALSFGCPNIEVFTQQLFCNQACLFFTLIASAGRNNAG